VEITPERDLVEVAFVVCTALNRTGTVTVLTGGSAATYYAPSAYQSRDADFIIVMNGTSAKPNEALARLGYSEHGGIYHHANSEFTWNPPGPLAVGSDIISTYETYHRDELMLHVLSRTDSVRDRLAGFYHWDDRSGLRVALDVAMGGPIDLETVERWSVHEHQGAKFAEFQSHYEQFAHRRARLDISSLPVYEPGPNELIDRREDLRIDLDQTMRVLGRSADGGRVLGRCGGGILSVARTAFAKAPRVDETITISRTNGREVARTSERDIGLER